MSAGHLGPAAATVQLYSQNCAEFSSIELVGLDRFFLNSFVTNFRTVVLELKLNQKGLTLVGNRYKINAYNCLPPRFIVGLNGSPTARAGQGEVAWRWGGLCVERTVGAQLRARGWQVQRRGRDHGVGLPMMGHVGQESNELGQGWCQGELAGEVVTEAWAAQVPAARCPGLSLSSAQGRGGL